MTFDEAFESSLNTLMPKNDFAVNDVLEEAGMNLTIYQVHLRGIDELYVGVWHALEAADEERPIF